MVDTSYENYLRLVRAAKRADQPCTKEVWNELVCQADKEEVITTLAHHAGVPVRNIGGDTPKTSEAGSW